jgi:hypothetical protein
VAVIGKFAGPLALWIGGGRLVLESPMSSMTAAAAGARGLRKTGGSHAQSFIASRAMATASAFEPAPIALMASSEHPASRAAVAIVFLLTRDRKPV